MFRMAGLSVSADKIQILVGKHKYVIEYSEDYTDFGLDNTRRIAENLLYLLTAPKCLERRLSFDQKVFFENLIDKGIYKELPLVADELDCSTKSLVDSFNRRRVFFKHKDKPKISLRAPSPDDALIGMSFGKDSLLSYGLAKELGMHVTLVFFNDTEEVDRNEYRHKLSIIRRFKQMLGEDVIFVRDNTDRLFNRGSYMYHEFIRTNAMLSYTLEVLPIAHNVDAKYLIMGNEQNFNDSFMNKDGYRAYPSYDQTSEYMYLSNLSLERFGTGFRVVSLIEPIYNIVEYKMLNERYKKLLPFLMSCGGNRKGRWCYKCPMCAKNYLYSKAVGVDPKKAGFQIDFFSKEFKRYYPLFSKPGRAYEKPRAVRDEQLFAFYLAHKRGVRGDLLELFKKSFLDEAKSREDELFKKFFGIHRSLSMPAKLSSKIGSIIKEVV